MVEPELQTLVLEGPLTMSTVRAHVVTGRQQLANGPMSVDLSRVTEADSAALALMLDWVRAARKAGHPLSVRQLPEGMRTLAELYGVAELLPTEA